MSGNKGEQKQAPKCPAQNELPPSEVVWQGRISHLGDYCPCRIVLEYCWRLCAKAESWVAEAEYVFECAYGSDAMHNPRWETQPKTDIPNEFFGDVLDAFRISGHPRPAAD